MFVNKRIFTILLWLMLPKRYAKTNVTLPQWAILLFTTENARGWWPEGPTGNEMQSSELRSRRIKQRRWVGAVREGKD